MKGILQVVAALLLLNVTALTLWSRAAPPAPAARPTRVAVFNLARVIKNYEKFKTYQIELKEKVDPFHKRDDDLKEQSEKLAKEAEGVNLTPDQRVKFEKQLTKLRQEIEDNKAQAQKVLIKEQERQLVSLYADVEAAARRLAERHGYALVMHYNRPEKEEWSPQSIRHKRQVDALTPIFIGTQVELSDAILEELHKDMKQERR